MPGWEQTLAVEVSGEEREMSWVSVEAPDPGHSAEAEGRLEWVQQEPTLQGPLGVKSGPAQESAGKES